MRRNAKSLTAVLSAATAVASALVPFQSSAATTYVWTAGTADYNTPTNWNPATVPGSTPASDIAAVSNGGTIQILPTDPLWTVNQLWAGDSSTGSAGNVVQTGGTVNISSGGFIVLGHGGTTGNYNISGGTINLNGTLRAFGNASTDPTGAATVLSVSGASTVVNISNEFDVGYYNGTTAGAATFNMSGGTITNNGILKIGEGSNAVGSVTISGGILNQNNELWIGDSGNSTNHVGGTGTFTMTGGTVITKTWAVIGRGGSSTGTMNLDGGTFIHLGGSGDFEVASYGGNNNTANTATLNLNGGTLETNFIRNESPGGSTQTINFNGSVIQPNNSDNGFIGGHGNFTALNVLAGGVKFVEGGAASLDYAPTAIGYTDGITQTLIGSPGDGGVTVTGPGCLQLSASNSYNGNTTVNGAQLQITNDNALGNSTKITLNNGQLINNGENGVSPNPAITLSGSRAIVIVGTGYLDPGWQGWQNNAPISGGNLSIVTDSGLLTMASSNSYTGSTTIGSLGYLNGTGSFYDGGLDGVPFEGLRLANANALPTGTGVTFGVDPNKPAFGATLDLNGYSPTIGTLNGAGTSASIINTNAGTTSTLTLGNATGNSAGINASTVSSYAGSIYDVATNASWGSIAVTKVGPGTQVLGGTMNYSGGTTLSAGKLYINGSLATSVITVAPGTTLGGSGVINTAITIPSGASLEGGYQGTGTLNAAAGLSLAGGSSIVVGNLTMYQSSAGVPAINVSGGALTLSGNVGVSVTSATGVLTVGSTYDLLNYASGAPLGGVFAISGSLPDRATGSISDTGSQILLTINGVDFLKWTGSVSSSWDTVTPNFKLNSNGNAVTYINNPGDTVVFDDTASSFTVNVGSAILTPSAVTFNNSSHAYTVTGTGGISGLTGLTKLGSNVLTLDTSNSYIGATNISAGTLQIGTGGSISPSSAIVLGGGNATLELGDANGPVNISGGSLSGAGSIIGGNAAVSTLTFPVNSNFSLGTFVIGGATAGNTTANAIALVKTGGATLTVPNVNNYTGGTTITAGTVQVGASGALGTGTVNITGSSTVQALGNVTLANAFTLGNTSDTFDTNGYTLTLSGAISNTFGTDVQVIKPVGAGNLVLSGTLNVGGGSNDTNNPAILMASTGNTTTVTATGTINGISLGWYSSTNVLNLAPAGTLNFTNTDPAIDVGQGSGAAAGAIYQTGGTVNASGGNLSLGKWDGSYGAYILTGGTVNFGGIFSGANGNGNGNSYFQQSGGQVNVGGYTTIGQNNAGFNAVLLTGGNYNNANNLITLANGGGSTAELTIGGTATMNASGVVLGANTNAASVSTLNINPGGTLATGSISQRYSSSVGIVNFNGGVVVASASNQVFMNNVTDAYVYAGGAVFNTAGQSITVGQNLTSASANGAMGLNTGAQVTSGGSGYIAPPVVNVTSSDGNGFGATAVASVTNGVVTGITITSPGSGYTSAPNFSFYGGAGSGAGATASPTANATDGGLIKQGTGTLTLSGVNTYVGNTVVQGGTLVAGSTTAFSTGTVVLNNTATLGFGKLPVNVMSLSVNPPNYPFTANSNGANNFVPLVSASGNSVQMTSAQGSEATSLFSSGTYPISDATGFSATFTYSHATIGAQGSAADGITFTVQSATANALGQPGGQLGYGAGTNAGITNSVATVLDLYENQFQTGINGFLNSANNPTGVTTTLNGVPTNGASGVSSVPISLAGTFQVDIAYNYTISNGGELRTTLTNPANGSSWTYVTDGVDVAALLGGSPGGTASGYIGFTGATGGVNDAQTISNFSFDNNQSAGITYTGVSVANAISVTAGATSTIQLSSSNVSTGGVGAITIGNGATLKIAGATNTSHGVLITPSITTTSGTLDVENNALDITGMTLAQVSALAKTGYANGAWNGSGISSSSAAASSSHLTAVGVIVNSNGTNALYGTGAPLGLFGGVSPASTDILVKYTYYGDTNLNGKVDGGDYSRVDAAFASEKTGPAVSGWYNGDFNYDGVVNGSDYTLMDNTFNMQGANLSAQVAAQTAAQIGTSAVPEPASLTAIAIGTAGLLGRRRRH